jgi:hypothetical protein
LTINIFSHHHRLGGIEGDGIVIVKIHIIDFSGVPRKSLTERGRESNGFGFLLPANFSILLKNL